MTNASHHRHELKAALDALAVAEETEARLATERQDAFLRHGQYVNILINARITASKLLRKEGGSAVHAGQFWRADPSGSVSRDPVKLNLDAQEPTLQLTPPAGAVA